MHRAHSEEGLLEAGVGVAVDVSLSWKGSTNAGDDSNGVCTCMGIGIGNVIGVVCGEDALGVAMAVASGVPVAVVAAIDAGVFDSGSDSDDADADAMGETDRSYTGLCVRWVCIG